MRPFNPGWIDPFLARSDAFPRPRWKEIDAFLAERAPESEWPSLYDSAAREWAVATCAALGDGYETSESREFLFVSPFAKPVFEARHAFAERCRRRILEELLPGIARVWGFGKHVAFVFRDVETYYSYVAPFYPEPGAFAASAGMFLGAWSAEHPHGYGHFVLRAGDLKQLDHALAHELVHNLLASLPLPLWLDEGLATSLDAQLAHGPPLVVRREDLDEHRATWGAGGIQEFWSGRAWEHPDDRNRLAYQLAQMAVRALAKEYASFRAFVLRAHREDGGEHAAREVYGRSLGELVGQMLGPGEWAPEPRVWSAEDARAPESAPVAPG
ncbi:MAG: hypothetical protein IPJ77_17430 [Planctomycetes bacterium]|nr:hypothetical protein [Planctomycetota bacterium]